MERNLIRKIKDMFKPREIRNDEQVIPMGFDHEVIVGELAIFPDGSTTPIEKAGELYHYRKRKQEVK